MESAPEVDIDSIETRALDGYNGGGTFKPGSTTSSGWTLSPTIYYQVNPSNPTTVWMRAKGTFTRSSGASTRGGGVCLIKELDNGSFQCTTDASCTTQFGAPPSGGYNYCATITGQTPRCFQRPGGDSLCYKSPANSPGYYFSPTPISVPSSQAGKYRSLGCLADANCPFACGITDVEDSCYGKYQRSIGVY